MTCNASLEVQLAGSRTMHSIRCGQLPDHDDQGWHEGPSGTRWHAKAQRQPREHAVECAICGRETWEIEAVHPECDRRG